MNFPDFKRLIRPITNKIFLLLGRAVLKAVENSNDTQLIQVIALADETITNIERFQEYGFETYPLAEAQVFIGFLNGNRDHGIALCVHDDRYRPKDLVKGEVALYTDEDSSDFRIHLMRNRIFNVLGDKWNEVLDTSKVITTPSETHTNSTEHIIDSPEVSLGGAAFAGLRQIIDERVIALFNAHVHSGCTTGPNNSGVPTTTLSLANCATSKVKAI